MRFEILPIAPYVRLSLCHPRPGMLNQCQIFHTFRSPTGLFNFEWLDGGAIAIKASNGRYITARMNGSLYAVSDAVSDKERFYFTIINRPLLVLRCEFGFVGQKTASNTRLECNKATHDIMYLEHSDGEPGSYFLKGRLQKCAGGIVGVGSLFEGFCWWPRAGSTSLEKLRISFGGQGVPEISEHP